MTTQSLELTRSAKLYHAIRDYCKDDRPEYNKPARRYLYISCLGYPSFNKLIEKTFTDYDLNTLPVQEIKQVIFDVVNIIADEVNNSNISDYLKSKVHKNLLYMTKELFEKLWDLEINKSRANELRKILLVSRRFYYEVDKHLSIIQKVEYKISQNSTNSITFDDFTNKMKDLKDLHLWDDSNLRSDISFDDHGMYNLGYYGMNFYRPNIIGNYFNTDLVIRDRRDILFTQDTNLVTCGNCGSLELPVRSKPLINDSDNLIRACENCLDNAISVFNDYTKFWVRVAGDNKNLYDVKIKGCDTQTEYLPEKEKLDNHILKYGLLDHGKDLIQLSIDYNEPERLLFYEVDGYHIQYEFLVLMSEIISKFELRGYIELANIKQRYIETMQELKIKYLYVRRDEYYYYLPENRQIESTQDLESKGMKSKKWTNFFKKFLNTDNSSLLEKVSRYTKTRIKDIQDLVNSIKTTKYIYDIYSMEGINSCMSGEEYVKFYEAIGDVELAYMEDPNDDDLIIGRALIWHNVEARSLDSARVSFMDRIYSTGDQDDEITQAFKQLAKNKGYYWKKHQSYTHKTDFIDPNTMENIELLLYKHCDMDLDEYSDHVYPYIDSMTYGYSNVLTNDASSSYIHEFNDTDGGGLSSGIICDICGERHSEDEITCNEEYDGNVCDSCLDNDGRFFYCDSCHSWHFNETSYYLKDGSHEGETVCDIGLEKWDYVLDHNGSPVYIGNAININDEWYKLDDVTGDYFYCEGTGDHYFFDDCKYIETEKGLYYSEYTSQFEEVKELIEIDKKELENNTQLELQGVRV